VRSLAEGEESEGACRQPRPGTVLISISAERSLHLPIRNGLQAGRLAMHARPLPDADRELPAGTGHRHLPDDHAQAGRPPWGTIGFVVGEALARPASRSLPGTLIKSKNPRNDQPENASQSKVTRAAARHVTC
jgi:hypothetical protein